MADLIKDKISVIVPCYNEQEALPAFFREAEKTAAAMPGVDFEYIFVDDGSRDGTLALLRQLAESNNNVRYVSFSRNFGKEAAILAGLREATGDYTVLMDADLQDPPALLPEMYKAVKEEGYDSAATRRTTRKGEPKVRTFFARQFYKLINGMSSAKITDGARDYRLMSRAMTDAVLSLTENERFTKGIFAWVGFKTKWIGYENIDRVAGKTKWSFVKLFKYAVGGITDFSTAPLKLAFFMTIVLLLSLTGLLAAVITLACLGKTIPLVLSLSSVIVFIACMFSALLAVQNLYIAKLFAEAKDRPVYIIKETDKIAGTDKQKTPADQSETRE